MDALADLSWRVYPSAALMAAGLGLAARAAGTLAHSLRASIWDSERP